MEMSTTPDPTAPIRARRSRTAVVVAAAFVVLAVARIVATYDVLTLVAKHDAFAEPSVAEPVEAVPT